MKRLNVCFAFILFLSVTASDGTPLDLRKFILKLEDELEIDRYLKTSYAPKNSKYAVSTVP